MSIASGLAAVRLAPRPRPIAWTNPRLGDRMANLFDARVGMMVGQHPPAGAVAHRDAARHPFVTDGALRISRDFGDDGAEQGPRAVCSRLRGAGLGSSDSDDERDIRKAVEP